MTIQAVAAGIVADQSLAWDRQLDDEFRAWRAAPSNTEAWAKGNPSPLVEGGLPPGYEAVAQCPHEELIYAMYVLVRRVAGGWVLVRHETDIATTLVSAADPHLGALCERVASGEFGQHLIEIAARMRRTIGSLYDQHDETEAAAYTMWTLGGPMMVEPRAITLFA